MCLKTTVTVFPVPDTDLMSSQPVRLMGLLFGLMKTFHVARKSLPVTGLPSLHLAEFLNVNLTVNGLLSTIFGLPVHSRGTRSPCASRISQPYQMLFSTSDVAARLLPTHGP